MTVSGEWEADLARAKAAAADMEERAGLAEAVLERIAGEGADADGGGDERVQAVEDAAGPLESLLADLTRRLDAAAEAEAGAFARLKTGDGVPRFEPLAARLEGWLLAADALLHLLCDLSASLKRCHAAAEMAFGQVIERRGAALRVLEAAQKIAQESRPPLKESAFRLAATRDEDERLALGAVHAERRAQLEAAEAKELALLAEFTGLDAVAALFDVFTAVLNRHAGALNLMNAKLCVDAERVILLRAAVLSFAGMAEGEEVLTEEGGLSPLLALFRRGLLSHAETMRRKALADERFARRFAKRASR